MTSIGIHQHQSILELKLQRVERKNAFTHEMYSTLAQALRAADENPEIKVVILSGDGGNFSSGNDLQDFLSSPPQSFDAPVFQFLLAISELKKIILCAVDGYAVGIGTTLLLHADFVYASPQAQFSVPFLNLGLTPEAASSLLLPQLVGYRKANELLLLGETLPATEAKALGLVNELVEAEQLAAYVRGKAEILAKKPKQALLSSKALLKKPYRELIAQTLREEGKTFMQGLTSPETKEAIQSFFAKKAKASV